MIYDFRITIYDLDGCYGWVLAKALRHEGTEAALMCRCALDYCTEGNGEKGVTRRVRCAVVLHADAIYELFAYTNLLYLGRCYWLSYSKALNISNTISLSSGRSF